MPLCTRGHKHPDMFVLVYVEMQHEITARQTRCRSMTESWKWVKKLGDLLLIALTVVDPRHCLPVQPNSEKRLKSALLFIETDISVCTPVSIPPGIASVLWWMCLIWPGWGSRLRFVGLTLDIQSHEICYGSTTPFSSSTEVTQWSQSVDCTHLITNITSLLLVYIYF